MLVTYQTACERQETSNFWRQINAGDASPASSLVQRAPSKCTRVFSKTETFSPNLKKSAFFESYVPKSELKTWARCHCLRKPPFFCVQTAPKITRLKNVQSGDCCFGYQNTVYVWTEPYLEKKKFRFQKYTCGRGVSLHMTEDSARPCFIFLYETSVITLVRVL